MLAIGTDSIDSAFALNHIGLKLLVFTAIFAVKVEDYKLIIVYNYVYLSLY